MTKRAKILITDDDTRLRELLKEYLDNNNFATDIAKDTDEARKMIKATKYNLLIIDVMLPGESGIDFLKNLRKESNIPAIILSAVGDAKDRVCGLESGANDYVTKPFEPQELILRIKNLLK
jgi:two-component system, OmpR family, phosphate regulon response regulator OmpR|tara:strand:+ start:5773 stop:6135 length:363 start_codon:yes stop_codon:yes gene_type:complete